MASTLGEGDTLTILELRINDLRPFRRKGTLTGDGRFVRQ